MDNQGISPGNSDQDVRRAAGACPHCGGRNIALE
jgi:hypothetical protein